MNITGICTTEVQEQIIVIPFVQSFFVHPHRDKWVLTVCLFGGKDMYFEYNYKDDAYRDRDLLAVCIEVYYKEVLQYVTHQ